MSVIPTQKPDKGDLVKGHSVYAVFKGDLPAVPGKIIKVSETGHEVVMEVSLGLSVLGLTRRTTWTWRKSAGSYQQKGSPTVAGTGLVLDKRKPSKSSKKPKTAKKENK